MGRKPFALKPPIIIKLLHNLSPQQHQCSGGCLGRFQCKGEERGWYHSSDREKGGTCKGPFGKVNDVLQGPNQGKLGNWRVPIRDWRCHRWQTHLDDHPSSTGRALSSLSSGRRACMLTESRVIPMNSRTLESRKVLLWAIGMFKSSNKVMAQHLTQRCCAEGGWCWLGKKSHQEYEQWTIY